MFMSEPVDIAETRQGMILEQLAGLGMSLARDLHARALAAETTEEAVRLAEAFHKVARSVRQTLALEPRLIRDHSRNRRDAEAETARLAAARAGQKKARIRLAVERLIWTEAEDDEAERLVDDLDDLLDAEALSESFTETPVEALIEKVRADLGLAAAVIYTLDGKAAPAALAGEAPAVQPNSS